jgi:meso-butanediol dehydrogenase/(S,S)-butanediol dehydrogenase/diacetyl reductase
MDKCIVVTGAGSGLGRALARRLAADGNAVILFGRTRATLDSVAGELGARCKAIVCDVANATRCAAAFAGLAEQHPKIDVLINNAAIYKPFFVKDATDAQISDGANDQFRGSDLLLARRDPADAERRSHHQHQQ